MKRYHKIFKTGSILLIQQPKVHQAVYKGAKTFMKLPLFELLELAKVLKFFKELFL